MPMDACRDGEDFVVEFDLPGVNPDSIGPRCRAQYGHRQDRAAGLRWQHRDDCRLNGRVGCSAGN
jgi:hypothetical protein